MRLSQDEIEAAYYGLWGFVRERCIGGRPVPQEVRDLVQRLDLRIRMSDTRPQSGSAAEEQRRSEVWVGTRQAAAMLNMSPRQVQRLAGQIGGTKISERCWTFRESDVINYAERTAHADPRN